MGNQTEKDVASESGTVITFESMYRPRLAP